MAHSKINSARQKAKAEEERRQKEEMAAKLFKRLDQNGDGDVSIAELQEALLQSSETVRMLGLTSIIVFDPKTDKMVVQRKELTEFLQRWDKDGNGVLSKAEFSRMFQLKDKPKGKKYSAFSSTNYREYDRDKMEEEARQLQREPSRCARMASSSTAGCTSPPNRSSSSAPGKPRSSRRTSRSFEKQGAPTSPAPGPGVR